MGFAYCPFINADRFDDITRTDLWLAAKIWRGHDSNSRELDFRSDCGLVDHGLNDIGPMDSAHGLLVRTNRITKALECANGMDRSFSETHPEMLGCKRQKKHGPWPLGVNSAIYATHIIWSVIESNSAVEQVVARHWNRWPLDSVIIGRAASG